VQVLGFSGHANPLAAFNAAHGTTAALKARVGGVSPDHPPLAYLNTTPHLRWAQDPRAFPPSPRHDARGRRKTREHFRRPPGMMLAVPRETLFGILL
jgi:hypothetical protein